MCAASVNFDLDVRKGCQITFGKWRVKTLSCTAILCVVIEMRSIYASGEAFFFFFFLHTLILCRGTKLRGDRCNHSNERVTYQLE